MLRVTDTAGVTVLAPLSVTISGPSQSYVGTSLSWTVVWYDSVDIPSSIHVEWGDASSSDYATSTGYSVTVSHTYGSARVFTVTASVVQAARSGSDTHSITIAAAVTAVLNASPNQGQAPLPVSFSGSVGGGYPPYVWSIDYGDGSAPVAGSGATVSASHTYTVQGAFIATLTAEDSLGGATQLGISVGVGLAVDYVWLLVPLGIGAAIYLAHRYL